MKKFLCVLLTVAMLLSTMIIVVSAEETAQVVVDTLVVDDCENEEFSFFKKGGFSDEKVASGEKSWKLPVIAAGELGLAGMNIRSEYGDKGAPAYVVSGMDRMAFELYVSKAADFKNVKFNFELSSGGRNDIEGAEYEFIATFAELTATGELVDGWNTIYIDIPESSNCDFSKFNWMS